MTDNDCFDLDGWLRRIGHHGSRTPTLQTLRGVIAGHAMTIPYENIDVLLGRPPQLAIDALQRKMVYAGRGGYCFEQNLLLRAGLLALGFSVTGHAARVVRGVAASDTPRPVLYAAHIVLRVDLAEGPFLADVGAAHLTPTGPLLLQPDIEQETPHEAMRFSSVNNELTLQRRLGDEWESLYWVLPYSRLDADYEVANWFTATHPKSPFVRNLIIARPHSEGVRSTLLNGRLTVRRHHNVVEQRMLHDSEFASVLGGTFGLALSDADLNAALEALDRHGSRGVTLSLFS